ncbi:InlB B-repeat-containing protein [Erysipelothrix sp. HDW6B]|uniref:InlB B-repeat-containing protein n=1 Tax=Erysipelothrix TaxID=1647 RepID=UPI001358C6A4|nr:MULTISPECIES: InlB B-repeat-containing protein [Erysipelothrix]QIK85490.1 InlB B-repeat-containing protein [Erysipelothrix sp. HDW6B]
MNDYKVKFDAGDAVTQISSVLVTDGSYLQEPQRPTRNDAIFKGWFHDEALKYPWNFESDIVIEDVTLHAKWDLKDLFAANKQSSIQKATQDDEKYIYAGGILADLAESINFIHKNKQ